MGEWKDKIQGKGEELEGKVTGDRSEEMKGKGRQTIGAVEGAVDDARDAVGSAARRSDTGDDLDTKP